MTPERWSRVAELFDLALAQEPSNRHAFLASACRDDDEVRIEIEELLESHEQAGALDEISAVDLTSVERLTGSRAAATLARGDRLGRYEIVEWLGAGGMGEVYRARDPQLDREIGIKILTPHAGLTSAQLKRFLREARAAAALNHTNILTVYDIGTDGDTPYVVSELLEGQTLRARLEGGPLPASEVVSLALQIVAGLDAAHEKGLVHRDLKPENLFLTTEGVVKILDFGLAKRSPSVTASVTAGMSAVTERGFIVGTAGYMSPEQVRGLHADARSDLFAFGCVLYELLTGRRAFSGDSAVETMNAILTSEPPALPSCIPGTLPALDALVRKCLGKEASARPTSARELEGTLREIAPHMPRSAPAGAPMARLVPYTTAERVHDSRRGPHDGRIRLRPIAVGILGLALAAAVVGAVRYSRRPPGPGLSGRPALAVMAFDDHSRDPQSAWLSTGVPRMIVTALAQTPGVDVIGSDRLQASVAQVGGAGTGRAPAGQIARHAGAGAVLVGSLFRVGDELRIDVQLEDVESGRVVVAASEHGRDVFAMVDALTVKIRRALDVGDRPSGRPVRDVTTTSLGAYEFYVKALEASFNHRRADARTLLEQAIRLDPDFALAHAQLAIVLERLGEPVKAAAHRREVMGRLDRLPDRQRLLALAKHESETDLNRARDAIERLLQRYPDEEEAYDLMVHTYAYTRDPEHANEALTFMQRWAQAIPGPGSGHFHNHYGYALIEHGLFTEAEKAFRAYISVSSNEANPYDSLAELFLLTGRPDAAIASFDDALRRNPVFGNSHFGRAYACAMLGEYGQASASIATLEELGSRAGLPAPTIALAAAFFRSRLGQYDAAAERLAAAVRLARESGDAIGEADAYGLEAAIALERGQFGRVQTAVDRLRRTIAGRSADAITSARSTLADVLESAGSIAAGRLDTGDVRRVVATRPERARGALSARWQQMLAGEHALAAGDLVRAEERFAAVTGRSTANFGQYPAFVAIAHNLPFRDGLARIKVARGDLRGAVSMYARLNQPNVGAPWPSVFEPRFVLAAARVARRAGDDATARAEYARFLTLWKHADPGLPELSEARAYIAR
jgi:eukaryotic-like serine/threonine-protein kinase